MRKASLVGGGILLLVGLSAWLLNEPAAKGPLDRYARQGASAGEAALGRDLTAEFPLGTPVSPLVHRLTTMGMRCVPPPNPDQAWLCNARLQSRGRDQLHAQVVIATTQNRVLSLVVSFVSETPPL